MSFELCEVDRKALEDESQGISLAKSRKVKNRWTLRQKRSNGKGDNPLCTRCRKNDGIVKQAAYKDSYGCLLYTSPSPRDRG